MNQQQKCVIKYIHVYCWNACTSKSKSVHVKSEDNSNTSGYPVVRLFISFKMFLLCQ